MMDIIAVPIAAFGAITVIVCLAIITDSDYSVTAKKNVSIELKPKR